jgi:hypothetical protein
MKLDISYTTFVGIFQYYTYVKWVKDMFTRCNNNVNTMKPKIIESTCFNKNEGPPIILHNIFKM